MKKVYGQLNLQNEANFCADGSPEKNN